MITLGSHLQVDREPGRHRQNVYGVECGALLMFLKGHIEASRSWPFIVVLLQLVWAYKPAAVDARSFLADTFRENDRSVVKGSSSGVIA